MSARVPSLHGSDDAKPKVRECRPSVAIASGNFRIPDAGSGHGTNMRGLNSDESLVLAIPAPHSM